MFAIEITEANLETILASDAISPKTVSGFGLFIRAPRRYYFVQGYVTAGGKYQKWGILTENSLVDNFEFDPETIQTNWDQIVRIPQP